MEGVVHAMFMSKVKIALAVLLVVVLTAVIPPCLDFSDW
jgi:hypothetical protein